MRQFLRGSGAAGQLDRMLEQAKDAEVASRDLENTRSRLQEQSTKAAEDLMKAEEVARQRLDEIQFWKKKEATGRASLDDSLRDLDLTRRRRDADVAQWDTQRREFEDQARETRAQLDRVRAEVDAEQAS